MNINNEESCPCKSGKTLGVCCGPLLRGEKRAETAEALMRARYTAYVVGDVEFLRVSSTKGVQAEFDEATTRAWSKAAEWHGLEIISTSQGQQDDREGVVEFRALYSANREFCNHHEVAKFVREDGEWKFEDGELIGETPMTRETPKVGRNDPCPCGSGKKYKKCCGQ